MAKKKWKEGWGESPNQKRQTSMAEFRQLDQSIKQPVPKAKDTNPVLHGIESAGLGVLKGANQIGALGTDLIMAPHDLIMGKVNPDYANNPYKQVFPRSAKHNELWNSTVGKAAPVPDTTANKITGEIGEFIPSLAISGGMTRAAGLAPTIERAATAASKKLPGLAGKGAGIAVKTTPDMVNTYALMEAPKLPESRTPFPEWAATWVGGELAFRGAGKALGAVGREMGKGISKAAGEINRTLNTPNSGELFNWRTMSGEGKRLRNQPGMPLALPPGIPTAPSINLQGQPGNMTYPSVKKVIKELQDRNPGMGFSLNGAAVDRETVSKFVDNALANKTVAATLTLREVTPTEALIIKKLTGIDATGFKHELVDDGLRHAIKRHTNPEIELSRGQIPITDVDIKRIPDVINNFDLMMAGEKTGRGQGIVYQKRVNGTIYYVEMIQTKKGTLGTKTMWKKPSGGARATQDAGLGLTSEFDPGLTSSNFGKSNSLKRESAGSPGSINPLGLKPSGATDSSNINIIPDEPKVNLEETGDSFTPDSILGEKLSELDLRDTRSLQAYVQDVYRNFKYVFGPRFEDIKARILDPLDDAKGGFVDTQQHYLNELNEKIVQGLGIKKGSKESKLVQLYGEGGGEQWVKDLVTGNKIKEWVPYTKQDLIAEVGEEKARKIIQADAWFRQAYDRLVDDINAARELIYPHADARMAEITAKIEDLKTSGKYSKKVQREAIEELEWELNMLRNNPRRRSDDDTLYMKQLERKIEDIKKDPVYSAEGRRGLIDGLEAEYERVLRGKRMPKRNDYYRHFRELEGLEGLRNIFDSPAQIAPKLAGVSDFTKPNSRWSSIFQKRTKGDYEIDAVGGFLNYLPNAAYAIHVDPQIKNFRQLKDELVEGPGAKGNLNHFIEYLEDYANDLAGKTNPFDRGFQKLTGRKFFNAVNWVNNIVKANVILGNAGTIVAQLGNVPQGMAFAKQYSQPGLVRFNKSIMERSFDPEGFLNNNPMAKSAFLKERYADAMYRQFDTKILDKAKNEAVAMMEMADRIGTEFIWSACYEKALATKGVSDPIRFADYNTRRLAAGRGIGEVSLLQKSKVFQVVAPFQVEVMNLWHVMGEMAKDKDVTGGLILLATLFLFNRGSEMVRGSGVTLDPVEAIIDAVGIAKDKELSAKDKAIRIPGRLAGEVLSNVPLGQNAAAAFYPEYGGRWLGFDGWPSRKEVFGREDPTRFGTGFVFTKAINDPASKVLLPWGGVQLDKTRRGIEALAKGGAYTRDGEGLKYPVSTDPVNALKGVLFGPTGFRETLPYYDNRGRPLTEKQTQEFQNRVSKGEQPDKVYNEMMRERDQRREARNNPAKKASTKKRWKEGW